MRKRQMDKDPVLQRLIEEGEGFLNALIDDAVGCFEGTDKLVDVESWLNEVYQRTQLLSVGVDNLVSQGQSQIRGFRNLARDYGVSDVLYGSSLKEFVALISNVVDHIKSLPSADGLTTTTFGIASSVHQAIYKPNTAFIIMWMDPTKPEPEDVVNTYKEAFRAFGIQALRADDVEHAEVITDVVLEWIRNAEFLVADLTGERPNVYYELGYAHALGKRPIMYCREGTPRHFDIAGYNVPPYKNITQLKDSLRKRLAAMTGRQPSDSQRRTRTRARKDK